MPTILSPPNPAQAHRLGMLPGRELRARLACSLARAASDPPWSAMASCTRATSSSTWATASARAATCPWSV